MADKFESIEPDPSSLIESLRSIGYSTEAALCDIVDNSITAEASRIDIDFRWGEGEPWLAVVDNGTGMLEEELRQAMRLGSQNPLIDRSPEDLGRFGLGMKTASFSQCRIVTVISKKKGKLSTREWDLNAISEDPVKGWRLKVVSSADLGKSTVLKFAKDKLSKLDHGTAVVWRDLDSITQIENPRLAENRLNSAMNSSRQHMSLTYHRFLKPDKPGQKKVVLAMNNHELKATDPFDQKSNASQELSLEKITI
ncbi:MAG: ATP-binding protein, partial [Pirellulales bacterium]